MSAANHVFIAQSIDGYIAGPNGEIDWLDLIPNPEGDDLGYFDFIANIDALVMGRHSFETVLGFDVEWPYKVPVFVWSNTLKQVPNSLKDHVFLVSGTVSELLEHIHNKGYTQLYIDGGKTIQSFLKEDCIDTMTITTIPILLGNGIPLFGKHTERLIFDFKHTTVGLNALVQTQYTRRRSS